MSSPPNLAISALHEPTRVTALLHHPVLILWFLWLTASSDFLCGLMLVPLWLFLFGVGTVSALTLTARSAPPPPPPPPTHSKHTLISCNYTLLEQLSIRPRWETNTNETCLLMFCFPFLQEINGDHFPFRHMMAVLYWCWAAPAKQSNCQRQTWHCKHKLVPQVHRSQVYLCQWAKKTNNCHLNLKPVHGSIFVQLYKYTLLKMKVVKWRL